MAAFVSPPLASGRVRDHVLTVRGRATTLAALTALLASGEEARPLAFALHPAEPHPFTHTTRIRFDLPRAARVRLEMFDLQGRRVATLVDGAYPVGFHARDWDGRGDGGMRVAPGIYLYRLLAGEHRSQRTLVLMP